MSSDFSCKCKFGELEIPLSGNQFLRGAVEALGSAWTNSDILDVLLFDSWLRLILDV